jgi:hypothetical protein
VGCGLRAVAFSGYYIAEQKSRFNAVLKRKNMDRKTVDHLERELEGAFAEIIERLGSRELPQQPSRHTLHLMAKAAVTVYEAFIEGQRLAPSR